MTGRYRHGTPPMANGHPSTLIGLLIGLLVSLTATATRAERLGAYDYPFVDPVTATVVGTPQAFRDDLPDLIGERILDRRRVVMFPDREVSDVFWYDREGVVYGLAAQHGPAPLVFAIAGTNGSAISGTVMTLANGLFKGGFHVVTLPSPTSLNFIVNGSTTGVPGHMANDTADLYAVIQRVLQDLRGEIAFDEVHLVGLSLGAMNAAWLAELDGRAQAVGFGRVLVLNPPVSLYNSTRLLDRYFDEHARKGPGAVSVLLDDLFSRFSQSFTELDASPDLSGDFLFQLYQTLQPEDDDLEALVGVSFRISAANIAFVSDVMSASNYVVPFDAVLGMNTPLSRFGEVLGSLSFADYIDHLYLPFYQAREPGLTRQQAIARESLQSVEPFLRSASHVALIGTADDIILADGEVDYLEAVFGARAALYPTGGHCGNFAHPDFVARMNAWLSTGWAS